MPLVLNIETATKNCSVSLAKAGKVIALKEQNDGSYSHSENLHVFIEEVIKEAHINFSDLSAIAVSKGPGSYTGLRIGVSAAKGLCFSLDIPLISVLTLEVLAHSTAAEKDAFIIPLLDARRMEVYATVFDSVYNQVRETKAEIIEETSFSTYLNKGKVYFLGDGAEKCRKVIRHKNAVFLEGHFPSSREMAELTYEKYSKNDLEDVAYFEPFYLKDFIVSK
ncbi:MAG: tRNA (adenosine(37)-N6)-threonylcarbamoyltransferase complex dimerization subunit type 1 TsaB [Flavobacteriaceae bacterium]|nr:tRNA (adenosine(37)-N6)-threonylcarbamoyltransferase complex dimerization subunit type 1 TsaB [Flavobacteriaceae bacterium]